MPEFTAYVYNILVNIPSFYLFISILVFNFSPKRAIFLITIHSMTQAENTYILLIRFAVRKMQRRICCWHKLRDIRNYARVNFSSFLKHYLLTRLIVYVTRELLREL